MPLRFRHRAPSDARVVPDPPAKTIRVPSLFHNGSPAVVDTRAAFRVARELDEIRRHLDRRESSLRRREARASRAPRRESSRPHLGRPLPPVIPCRSPDPFPVPTPTRDVFRAPPNAHPTTVVRRGRHVPARDGTESAELFRLRSRVAVLEPLLDDALRDARLAARRERTALAKLETCASETERRWSRRVEEAERRADRADARAESLAARAETAETALEETRAELEETRRIERRDTKRLERHARRFESERATANASAAKAIEAAETAREAAARDAAKRATIAEEAERRAIAAEKSRRVGEFRGGVRVARGGTDGVVGRRHRRCETRGEDRERRRARRVGFGDGLRRRRDPRGEESRRVDAPTPTREGRREGERTTRGGG